MGVFKRNKINSETELFRKEVCIVAQMQNEILLQIRRYGLCCWNFF